MKKRINIISVAFAAFLCSSFLPAGESMSLRDAIQTGAVKCTITGNIESTHYIKPIIAEIKNRRNVPLNIRIQAGDRFYPEDSSYQNMIVSRQEMIALNAGGTVKVSLHAMCTENHDRAPGQDVRYRTAAQSNGHLLKLMQMIENKKLFDPLGQSAVWAMTCNTPLEDIAGFDTTSARQLVKYVAGALGKKVPPPPSATDTYRNYYAPVASYKVTMSGKFEYKFHKPKVITIAMFDKNNIVVRELFRKPGVEPGYHEFEYKFDASCYNDDYYYIRMIADGNIVINSKISMNKDKDEDEEQRN